SSRLAKSAASAKFGLDKFLEVVPIIGRSSAALRDCEAAAQIAAHAIGNSLQNLRARKAAIGVKVVDSLPPIVSEFIPRKLLARSAYEVREQRPFGIIQIS